MFKNLFFRRFIDIASCYVHYIEILQDYIEMQYDFSIRYAAYLLFNFLLLVSSYF